MNMTKLEVFFDYACPFCLRGYEYLTELLPSYPGIEVEWHPCEAHPRPEHYGLHTDLCARGMFFVLDNDADLSEYHRRTYRAGVKEHANIEDLEVVSSLADGLVDRTAFYQAILQGAYVDDLNENNRLAWEAYDFPAVPSYRMNGKLLKSIPGVGVNKQQLADFIGQNQL